MATTEPGHAASPEPDVTVDRAVAEVADTGVTPAEPAASPAPETARRADPPRRRAAETAPRRAVLVVPALLVVALGLLVVGLVTSKSVWLAASLVASVLAAVLLVVERLVQRRRTAQAPVAATDPVTADPADDVPPPIDLDAPAIDPDDPEAVWVVDGRPRYHLRDCATLASLTAEPIPRSQAVEDGFVACSLCAPAASDTGADAPRHAR